MRHYIKIIAKLHIRIKRSHATLVSSLDCSFEPLSNGIHAAFRVLRDAGHDVWKHGETVHCARLVMMHSLQKRSVKTKRLVGVSHAACSCAKTQQTWTPRACAASETRNYAFSLHAAHLESGGE